MTTETTNAADIRHRMITLAKKGHIEKVEELWLEFIANAPDDPDLYITILRQVAHSKAGDTGHTMLLLLLDNWKGRERWDVVHDIACGLAAAWPLSIELRAILIEALKHKHGHLPQFPSMLKGSRIALGSPLGDAADKFQFYFRALPGQCYRYAGKGVGVVAEADFERDKIKIDFPREKGRVFTTAGVREFLIYLPPDHFLARRATDPIGLADLAEKDPAELIRLVARGQGGRIKQGDMKELLLDGVLESAKWNTWWTKARAALKVDPLIEFPGTGGSHAEIVVRAEPKTLSQEIEERFFSAKTTRLHQIAEIRNLESVKAAAPPDPALVSRMLAHLEQQLAKSSAANVAARVEIAFMAHDLRALSPEATEQAGAAIPPLDGAIAGVVDYAFLGEMESDDVAVRALDLLATRDGDAAPARMAAALPRVQSKVAQGMWRDLGDPARKALAYPAVKRLLASPMSRPDTYLWVVKGLVEQRWPHLNDYFPLSTLVPELLDLVDEWAVFCEKVQGSPEKIRVAKALISRVKSMLKADQCQAIFDVGMMLSDKQMDELERVLSRHASLDNELRSDAIRRLGSARRVRDEQAVAAGEKTEVGESADQAPNSPPPAPAASGEDAVHYCTSKARDQKVLELQKLKQETIPENTRLMEEARQEGDLRENAAYHAAKERHKLLGNLSVQMQTQIQNAIVFEPEMVKTEVVGFGVCFTVHNNLTNAHETYTILGRWEADTDRHVLNYQAPFVQQFIGKSVGETVEVHDTGGGAVTPYRITRIENALLQPEWSAGAASLHY